MTWRPTPEADLIVARVFLGDCWIEREIKVLRPGDVIQLINPFGQRVHPTTFEPDGACVSVVTGRPRKMSGTDGENPHGYGVGVDVYDNMDAVKAAGFA